MLLFLIHTTNIDIEYPCRRYISNRVSTWNWTQAREYLGDFTHVARDRDRVLKVLWRSHEATRCGRGDWYSPKVWRGRRRRSVGPRRCWTQGRYWCPSRHWCRQRLRSCLSADLRLRESMGSYVALRYTHSALLNHTRAKSTLYPKLDYNPNQ